MPPVGELDQFPRPLGAGQGTEDDGVDQAEDRRVEPDADREDPDGRGGEPGASAEHPQRVPDVLQQGRHDRLTDFSALSSRGCSRRAQPFLTSFRVEGRKS